MKKWLTIGAILALLLGAGVAIAQLPNTLNVSSAPSGTAPAIRASGIDANISINLVPKGSGVVQVNGTPIAVSGGTVTSLTVNPGPLAVTGTTNLTGPLFIQPGTAVGLKRVGARIFHTVTDAPTTGTVLETLYTATIQANTLAVNGQSLHLRLYANTAANGNTKNLSVTFGGTTIFSTGATAQNNFGLNPVCDIYRTAAATQKAVCTANAVTSAVGSLPAAIGQIYSVTTPAETLSGAVAILVTGTTATAAADLTARAMTIDWLPEGQ